MWSGSTSPASFCVSAYFTPRYNCAQEFCVCATLSSRRGDGDGGEALSVPGHHGLCCWTQEGARVHTLPALVMDEPKLHGEGHGEFGVALVNPHFDTRAITAQFADC